MTIPSDKQHIIDQFRGHVSSGKAGFYKKYGMDMVMGQRSGSTFWDMDGQKSLINLHCNGGVFNLGHRNPAIVKTLKSALDDLDIGNHHLISRERASLAVILADLMPEDLDYTIFGVSGGEAVDLAIKVARAYTGKSTIISAQGGYHGHTGLALAAGDEHYRKPFGPEIPGFVQVPFGDIEAFEKTIHNDTAAVLLETIPATLGMVIPEKSYLKEIRRLCDQNNTLLILDEVQAGLGRTGKLWAFQHYGIVPDMVILGKGLSGGLYPISATVIRTPLEKVFHADPFIHVSTFGGSEVGCRVTRKVLEITADPKFLEHVNFLARWFDHELSLLQQKHSKFFVEKRQLGLMTGLKLRDDLSGPLLTKAAYDNGLLLVYANNDRSVCQCLPPLNMTLEEASLAIEKLDKALLSAKRMRQLAKAGTFIKSIFKK